MLKSAKSFSSAASIQTRTDTSVGNISLPFLDSCKHFSSSAALAEERWNVEKRRRELDRNLERHYSEQINLIRRIETLSNKRAAELYNDIFFKLKWANPPIASVHRNLFLDYCRHALSSNYTDKFPGEEALFSWNKKTIGSPLEKQCREIVKKCEKLYEIVSKRDNRINAVQAKLVMSSGKIAVQRDAELRWMIEHNVGTNKRDKFFTAWYLSANNMHRELQVFLRAKLKENEGTDVVNEVDPDFGMTAVMYAARNNNLDALEVLLDFGADVLRKSPDGRTALHFAAAYSNREIVLKLLEAGSLFGEKDNYGCTALDLARQNNYKDPLSVLLNWNYLADPPQGIPVSLDKTSLTIGFDSTYSPNKGESIAYSPTASFILPSISHSSPPPLLISTSSPVLRTSYQYSPVHHAVEEVKKNSLLDLNATPKEFHPVALETQSKMSSSLSILAKRLDDCNAYVKSVDQSRMSASLAEKKEIEIMSIPLLVARASLDYLLADCGDYLSTIDDFEQAITAKLVEIRLCGKYYTMCVKENLLDEAIRCLLRRWTVAKTAVKLDVARIELWNRHHLNKKGLAKKAVEISGEYDQLAKQTIDTDSRAKHNEVASPFSDVVNEQAKQVDSIPSEKITRSSNHSSADAVVVEVGNSQKSYTNSAATIVDLDKIANHYWRQERVFYLEDGQSIADFTTERESKSVLEFPTSDNSTDGNSNSLNLLADSKLLHQSESVNQMDVVDLSADISISNSIASSANGSAVSYMITPTKDNEGNPIVQRSLLSIHDQLKQYREQYSSDLDRVEQEKIEKEMEKEQQRRKETIENKSHLRRRDVIHEEIDGRNNYNEMDYGDSDSVSELMNGSMTTLSLQMHPHSKKVNNKEYQSDVIHDIIPSLPCLVSNNYVGKLASELVEVLLANHLDGSAVCVLEECVLLDHLDTMKKVELLGRKCEVLVGIFDLINSTAFKRQEFQAKLEKKRLLSIFNWIQHCKDNCDIIEDPIDSMQEQKSLSMKSVTSINNITATYVQNVQLMNSSILDNHLSTVSSSLSYLGDVDPNAVATSSFFDSTSIEEDVKKIRDNLRQYNSFLLDHCVQSINSGLELITIWSERDLQVVVEAEAKAILLEHGSGVKERQGDFNAALEWIERAESISVRANGPANKLSLRLMIEVSLSSKIYRHEKGCSSQ